MDGHQRVTAGKNESQVAAPSRPRPPAPEQHWRRVRIPPDGGRVWTFINGAGVSLNELTDPVNWIRFTQMLVYLLY
jgi:hypothetical protein